MAKNNSTKKGPLLAIDFGTKSCGLAISDPDCIVSLPFRAINLDKTDSLEQEIADICRQKEIKAIILGLPLNKELEETKISGQVREFKSELGNYVSIPVILWDEFLTTFGALNKLEGKKDVTREDKDIISAQILLQNYLEK